jgi:hypothetical protein
MEDIKEPSCSFVSLWLENVRFPTFQLGLNHKKNGEENQSEPGSRVSGDEKMAVESTAQIV